MKKNIELEDSAKMIDDSDKYEREEFRISVNEVLSLKSLKFKKLHKDAVIPTRSHPEDAGLDLYSTEDVFIPIGSTVKIPTGIATDIPSGYFAKIEDRSGTAAKGLRTGAGVVDVGYQGELNVVMHNITNNKDVYMGKLGYQIKKGDRVAQLIVIKCEFPQPIEVTSFDKSLRGDRGFNSTGR